MDDADKADLQQQRLLDAKISQIRGNTTTQGEIGYCDDCGDESRVISGLCVECRKVIEQKNKNWRV